MTARLRKKKRPPLIRPFKTSVLERDFIAGLLTQKKYTDNEILQITRAHGHSCPTGLIRVQDVRWYLNESIPLKKNKIGRIIENPITKVRTYQKYGDPLLYKYLNEDIKTTPNIEIKRKLGIK